MPLDKSSFFEAPIPGANYTSDTKNYAWHRPPEINDYDEAVEWAWKKLTEEESYVSLLTAFSMGVTLVQAADMFTLAGVGKGKWSVDFAVLLAGPVAHMMYLIAKGYGVDVELGIDKKKKYKTKSFFKALGEEAEIDQQKAKSVIDSIDEVKIQEAAGRLEPEQVGGFAGMKAQKEEI